MNDGKKPFVFGLGFVGFILMAGVFSVFVVFDKMINWCTFERKIGL